MRSRSANRVPKPAQLSRQGDIVMDLADHARGDGVTIDRKGGSSTGVLFVGKINQFHFSG